MCEADKQSVKTALKCLKRSEIYHQERTILEKQHQ